MDDPKSYVEQNWAKRYDKDPYAQGDGKIWPFGAEHWCNLEGKFLHIVSDMSPYADEEYETSICTLAVMGTRYKRDYGQSLPAEIDIITGESRDF